MPYKLSKKYPDLLHLEPYTSFHYPLYHSNEPAASNIGIKLLFEQDLKFTEAYCHHVWESISWKPYLKNLNVHHIKNVDTTFNRIARRFL